MNEFKESIKEQAKINFSPELRTQIGAILKREKTLKQVCEEFGGKEDIPRDTKTLRIRIEQLAGQEEDFFSLYIQYRENLSKRPRGYTYLMEILDMLENDLSQRVIADDYSISRNTLKDAIGRARKIYPDLDVVLSEHAQRHKKNSRREMSKEEREKVNAIIKEYRTDYDINNAAEEQERLSKEALNYILEEVSYLESKGYSQYEISKEIGVGVSTIRRYKAQKKRDEKLDEMKKSMEE